MSMQSEGFSQRVLTQDGQARTTQVQTPRALVDTPVFMPVGTQAAVKSLTPDEVAATGARLILANTYHLMLRPGAELIARFGGTPRFMGWPHAMLTDSGGYQVFSLAKLRKIDDDGVAFQSHLDGGRHRLTPEEAMRIQGLLGSDIAMVLDECPPGDAPRAHVEQAVRRTTDWARRCLAAPRVEGQARFGIVQGATHVDLRLAHLEIIASMPFDGVALGGFSVGEDMEEMVRVLHEIVPHMPKDRPRYLMGVGRPQDLLHAIAAGIDMFDCVLPTRNARNGQALTWHGRVNIRQARHRDDAAPLDSRCDCPVCTRYSRAYLRHLYVADELLAPRLLTQHNLHFYAALTRGARQAISEHRYAAFMADALESMAAGDEIGAATPGRVCT